ncbi:MAG: ZIP family metal transporter [Gammaproteobacteria bacterium]|nr:ZIP family metal transporter [Gammaproteobacteria bacterium]
MTLLTWIIAFSLFGGILSVLAASVFLLIPQAGRTRLLPHMVSFAIGALLGAAFLGLLPHALESPYVTDAHDVTFTVLIGILTFFILEKLVIWRHCHHLECEVHGSDDHQHHDHNHGQDHSHKSAGTLVLVGDAVHNFVDGVLIAAAFLTDIHLGIVTAMAVAAHEIPQEVGDFAILLQSGFSRSKALLFNVLSSLTTVLGALLAYYSLSSAESYLPYVLAIAASSFIYVAVADLIPGLHKQTAVSESIKQIVLIITGVTVVFLTHSLLH